VAAMEETLKAAIKKELRILATAWTSRMTEGRWIIQLGYSPERVLLITGWIRDLHDSGPLTMMRTKRRQTLEIGDFLKKTS
jgi:hypothetical protein